jgi:uncharacterized protein YqgC (DUF456 family)
MTLLLWAVAGVLVAAGLVGILLPALPGTILIFAGLLLAAWAEGFTRVGGWTLAIIGLLAAASYGVDFVAGALGVKRMGASPRAMVGAALGTLLGLAFGLPGVIFGPFAGAVLGELSAQRDLRRAGRAGLAAWLGFLAGAAVKVAIAFTMIAIFLAALFFF